MKAKYHQNPHIYFYQYFEQNFGTHDSTDWIDWIIKSFLDEAEECSGWEYP